MIDVDRINNTLGKMGYYLSNHDIICASISGGSDSDIIVHIICSYFREYLDKIHFVFSNTGIEYKATLNHLDFLENKYKIEIDRIKGMPIPLAIKTHGYPFISKDISRKINTLQNHNFQWENTSDINYLLEKYDHCISSLRWWCNTNGENSRFNIEVKKGLKEFLSIYEDIPKISTKCCDESKKKPMTKYEKSLKADLIITGERKAEGGIRSVKIKSCFENRDGVDRYMPLFFWDDDTKEYYKEREGIVYSDCYEVYGLKRTGCVGCPFARNRKEELDIMQKYEPQLYKACIKIFDKSYKMTDAFEEFKEKLKKTKNNLER